MKFTKAIVKTPCKNIIHGLTSESSGDLPRYDKALVQHRKYIEALVMCGLDVIVLDPDENYPDSTFIEDTALLAANFAIITNPGAPSRKGEVNSITTIIKKYFENVEYVKYPGTVDAGDILMADNFYYIGLSERTNDEGAKQIIEFLKKYGLNGTTIKIDKLLHLKSGVSYLGNNNLVAADEILNKNEFDGFNLIKIKEDENYAANCIRVNDYVIIPQGYPGSKNSIEKEGYKTIEVDVSEFKKLDGGLSCLSLRF